MGEKTHSQQSNLAGEFAVLSQLSMRGFIGTLTLGNAKSVDILVLNPRTNELFKLEVKTSLGQKMQKNKVFEQGEPCYYWPYLKKKQEEIKDKKLFYCFVEIENVDSMPKCFIVPSQDVAEYLKWENNKYWEKPHRSRKTGKIRAKNELQSDENRGRTFRINPNTNTNELFPKKNYLNNWSAFDE